MRAVAASSTWLFTGVEREKQELKEAVPARAYRLCQTSCMHAWLAYGVRRRGGLQHVSPKQKGRAGVHDSVTYGARSTFLSIGSLWMHEITHNARIIKQPYRSSQAPRALTFRPQSIHPSILIDPYLIDISTTVSSSCLRQFMPSTMFFRSMPS
jgi:hypothetical protein